MKTDSIWKDTMFTASATASPITYSVKTADTNETIFNGRAYAKPNNVTIDVNVNKICQNYLEQELPDLTEVTGLTTVTASTAMRKFYFITGSTTAETYDFLYDWSYEDRDFSEDILLSRPINSVYANGMLMFCTWWENAYDKVITKISFDPDDTEFNDPLYHTKKCGDWALYYLNKGGGFDSFLIEGKVRKKESFERYYTDVYSNNTTIDFAKKAYNNQITTSYELNTGWMNDTQSEVLAANLMSSNMVYLHDLVHNKIMPVIITDGEVETKKFKNDKKLISYTINVECSQKTQNI